MTKLLLPIALMLIMGCDGPQPSATAGDPVGEDSMDHDSIAYDDTLGWSDPCSPEVYLFYRLDEKHSFSDDVDVAAWLQQKEAQVLSGEVQHDLMHTNGAGPNGAHWNPSNDLFLAIVPCDYDNGTNPVTLSIWGEDIHGFDSLRLPVVWVELKVDDWQERLCPVGRNDLHWIFRQTYIDSVNQGLAQPIAPLQTGRGLSFVAEQSEGAVLFYWHCAFGE